MILLIQSPNVIFKQLITGVNKTDHTVTGQLLVTRQVVYNFMIVLIRGSKRFANA